MALCNIRTTLQELSCFKNNWKYKLLQSWPNIIGALHSKVQIDTIYQDSLALSVSNAAWLQEIHILSPLILSLINKELEHPYIKTITVKQKKQPPKKTITYKKTEREKDKTPIQPSTQEQKALAHLNDPELGKVLWQFRQRCT